MIGPGQNVRGKVGVAAGFQRLLPRSFVFVRENVVIELAEERERRHLQPAEGWSRIVEIHAANRPPILVIGRVGKRVWRSVSAELLPHREISIPALTGSCR